MKTCRIGRLTFGEAVGDCDSARGPEVALETTVDQALIRGLVTAFRVFVSGLSSV
jgi:hypothetical protein